MIRTVTVNEAVNILRDSGLRQGVYPFGVAIQSKEWIYQIFRNQLMNWIKERSGEET